MQAWRRTLDIKTEWAQAQDGEISTYQLAQVAAGKLTSLYPTADADSTSGPLSELGEIIDRLQELPEDADDDEFNDIWYDLYEWADTGKRLWIATIF